MPAPSVAPRVVMLQESVVRRCTGSKQKAAAPLLKQKQYVTAWHLQLKVT